MLSFTSSFASRRPAESRPRLVSFPPDLAETPEEIVSEYERGLFPRSRYRRLLCSREGTKGGNNVIKKIEPWGERETCDWSARNAQRARARKRSVFTKFARIHPTASNKINRTNRTNLYFLSASRETRCSISYSPSRLFIRHSPSANSCNEATYIRGDVIISDVAFIFAYLVYFLFLYFTHDWCARGFVFGGDASWSMDMKERRSPDERGTIPSFGFLTGRLACLFWSSLYPSEKFIRVHADFSQPLPSILAYVSAEWEKR